MQKISNATAITVLGSGSIDELRLYPEQAQMTTYTYLPGQGISAVTDVNCQTTHYEYDSFNRLKYLRDPQGNIIKSYDYNYQLR
jgi:YD repeat-containing protein